MLDEVDDVGLRDWMLENGSILNPILEEQWVGKFRDDWMVMADILFPATNTSDQDEIRKSIRMVYWGKMLDHACMVELNQLEPFSFISSPYEMELIYTMGKIDCLVPAHLQRLNWCEEHKLGKEPVSVPSSTIVIPSSDDSYTKLLSNLREPSVEPGNSQKVTPKATSSSNPKKTAKKDRKGKNPQSFITDELSDLAQAETRKLIVSTAKKLSQIAKEDELKDPDDFLGISELADRPVKPLSIKATITEADKDAFNAYINVDEDDEKGKFKIRAKNDDIHQTGPLIFLAQELCKYSGQPMDDIMESVRKGIPKPNTTRYSISEEDVLNIRKQVSQRTVKQNRDCERWALDALDCAKSIDGSFTIKDFILMLPEEISYREAGNLISRAQSNLAVKTLLENRRATNKILDIYTDPTLETIATGAILSAINSAKVTLEPMAAAVMNRLLATETDQLQTRKNLDKMLSNMTTSNLTAINSSTNLYNTFTTWVKTVRGEDDLTGEELIRDTKTVSDESSIDLIEDSKSSDLESDMSDNEYIDTIILRGETIANKNGIVSRSIYDE